VAGIAETGWEIVGVMPSPVLGGRGAVEALVHARYSP
jgi:predicted rRNA methylase YqxC with S4 and FtsJ domains